VTPQVKKLLFKLRKEEIDSILITKDINISYLTNFNSQESWSLITPSKRIYLTDFRYLEEVKSGVKGFDIYRINGSIFEAVAILAAKLKLKRVFFEAKNISFAEFKLVEASLKQKKIDFLPTCDFIESLRAAKVKDELKKIKKAVSITLEALEFIKTALKPGIKENQIALRLEHFVRGKGAKFAFDPIIASGINSAYPHAKITNKTISSDESVMVDIGVDFEGYKSDLTRVFFLGRIPLSLRKAYDIVLGAQQEAIKKIRAGIRASSIDKAARNFIDSNRLGQYFGHALGHGVGLEVHEAPTISSKNNEIIKEGMVFTVEPAVYIPRKFGLRIEDMVLVKQNGCEVLSAPFNNPT